MGANMGPIWGRQDPGGPHDGPMNFVIWVASLTKMSSQITICTGAVTFELPFQDQETDHVTIEGTNILTFTHDISYIYKL